MIHVLLVEDNPAHAQLVMRGLENHPIQNVIHHVRDGEAALDYLKNPPPGARPHVVLLDLRLPKIDGLTVLETIKADPALNDIPIVILTSSSARRDVMRAYSQHVNSYLVKPLEFDAFTNLMHDLGYYWLHWNNRPSMS
jgi:CheY-like chemotaxis protein